MKGKPSIADAYRKLEIFIKMAKAQAKKNPLIVVMLMHEYFRNIYPKDRYILKRFSSDYLENIIICLDKCIATLNQTDYIGTYFKWRSKNGESDIKRCLNPGSAERVYGRLWKKRLSRLRRMFLRVSLM